MECIDHGLKGGPLGYAFGWCKEQRKKVLLHRLVFKEANGYFPEVVRHTCDNPRCINPAHLLPGTWADNNRDRAMRNRSAKGVPTRRKLTREQAEEIRGRIPNESCNSLAKEFGVSHRTITNIRDGRTFFAGF